MKSRNMNLPVIAFPVSLLLVLSAGASAGEIKPYQAKTIAPVQAKPVQQHQAESVQPYQAKTLSAPTGAGATTGLAPQASAPVEAFFHGWKTYVPGGTYQTPSDRPGYDVLHVSAGARAQDLVINPGGTYRWGQIQGRWRKSENPQYPIELLSAKNGRNWKVGWDRSRPSAPQEIVIWDGFTWYKGRK